MEKKLVPITNHVNQSIFSLFIILRPFLILSDVLIIEKWISITWSQRERSILNTMKRRKAKWTGHILPRNCLIRHVMEGKLEGRIEVIRRWGRRSKQMRDDIKVARGYWKLKQEALDRTLWRTRFGRSYEPVVRQSRKWTNEWMNEWMNEWIP
jgi:hypothetical protein